MGMGPAGGGRTELRRWRRRLRHDGVVLLPVLAVTLLYFHPLLTSTQVIYGGLDITRQFYLFKQAAVAELQAGRLPLWLPSIYCGMPLLGALIDTPFHPWDLAAALARVPLPVTFNVGLVLHLLVGQIGAYVWVRQDSARRPPAVLAACWIWNPFVLNSIMSGDHNNIRAMLMVPAILAALEYGLDRHRFRRAFLLYGLLQAIQILCSGLQFAFYTCALCGVTAVGTFLHRRHREPRDVLLSRAKWWMMGSGLALAIPMVQLLPGLEYSALSVRSGTSVVWSAAWGIQPGLLLSYVAPFVYRDTELLLYWGIVPLFLAGVGIWGWRHPRRWWYLVLLVLSLVLCIGADWPLSAWLNELPLLRRFRGPFRVALFANLMLARFAAGGLTATFGLVERHRHLLWWRHSAQRSAALLVIGLGLALLWWPRSDFFTTWDELQLTVVSWGLSAAALGCLIRWRTGWALGLVLVVAPVDWALHLTRYWQPQSVEVFQPDATVEQLRNQSNGGSRVWLRGTPSANYVSLFGVPSVAGHHAFPLLRAAKYTHALDVNDGRLLRLAGTKYVLTYRQRADETFGPPIRSAGEVEVRVVRGEQLAQAEVRGAARWLRHGAAVWDVMQSSAWDPNTSPVLLEGKPPVTSRPVGTGGVVTPTHVSPTVRTYEVAADGPGYLVLAHTWYPAWQAEVNGVRTRVLRANYLFQAVPIPSGDSIVTLQYRSTAARVGMGTSLLGGLFFVVAYGMARWRDMRVTI